MKASMTRNCLCLGNRCSAPGTVVTLARGGGSVILEDASSDVIGYLGGGVHCPIRGGKGSSSFETAGEKFYGTLGEDPTCLS